MSDQASDFQAPSLLPSDAPPDAPILNPRPGDAIDYLNVFHTTVGYWIPGSKAVIANTTHPVVRGLNLRLGLDVPGPWGGEVDFAYEPEAWDILVRSDRAAPEQREFGIDAYDPTSLHRVGLAVHKNERLAMVCGENFPNILRGSENTLFRNLYRRTLHYLLDSGLSTQGEAKPALLQRDSNIIEWERPQHIGAVQYELPEFINFDDLQWYRNPAPYAHYIIEASTDGEHWRRLVDRRHGPWRGRKTDFFSPIDVRYLRFEGTFSDGKAFRVQNVKVFPAK